MKWDDLNQQQCSVARASAVLGDRWSLLILSDLFLGVKRFDDFHKRLGLSRTTLTNRLKLLEDHVVIDRRLYQTQPDRYEYRLTTKGHDLFPVVSTLVTWGDKYYSDEAGPPIVRQHVSCAHDIQPVLSCPQCQEEISARSVKARKRPENTKFAPVERGPVHRH
ncbi:MAG: winged helix-turn-helix transcriptional regulator [Pseudomonadales bacterium]